MMLRMNDSMAARWNEMQMSRCLAQVKLEHKLKELAEAEIIEVCFGIILESLFDESIDVTAFFDSTGCEAFINKIHVNDFIGSGGQSKGLKYSLIQAMLFSGRVLERLNCRLERFRFIISLDPDSEEITARFFTLRPDEPWGSEDPNDYTLEDVIMIDTQ